MKLKLVFKQAVRDFHNKLQLYISFTVFIIISIALILGLFSFNFTFQGDFNDLTNSTLPLVAQKFDFRFVSINGDKRSSLVSQQGAETYQVENGEFSQYVFQEILLKQFALDDQGSVLRPFNSNELTILANDLGLNYDTINNKLNLNSYNLSTYFDNNIINFVGANYGYAIYSNLESYQKSLNLTDDDLTTIFDEKGQIKDNLDQNTNKNLLRYAGYSKLNFFSRMNRRWFSTDPNDQFYDHNMPYNSSLMNKYAFETKIRTDKEGKRFFNDTNQEVAYGSLRGPVESWHFIDGRPGVNLAEALLPGEKWMEEGYDWSPENNNTGGFTGWTHIPEVAMRNEINNLLYFDRLPVDQIDPAVIKSGKYAFVNPNFLKTQNLKLGDTISYYTNAYESGYETKTIIGTATSKAYIFEDGNKTLMYVPFQQLMKLEWNPISNWYFSFPGIGKNFVAANSLLKKHFYNDFQRKLIVDSVFDNFRPQVEEIPDLSVAATTMLILNLITFGVGILTLILLFVVFYFITDQSIKLQKSTLRFLKSIGENNFELSLITSLSSLVPIIIGTGFGILASFGVSQIMISVTSTQFPFYIAPFDVNKWAWILLVAMMGFIFLMFLGMNMLIIGGRILRLGQNSSIGLATKSYIALKPVFKYFRPTVRIGISFVAKNIFKNILTFILLTLSFGVVLFSVQFNSSSDSSARSFENRYVPFRSVLFDSQNTSDSVRFNKPYLETYFPGISETLENPNLEPFLDRFQKFSYYKGAKTTYRDINGNYTDVINNQTVKLTPIEDQSGKTGDQIFNELIKNQINEMFRVSEVNLEMSTDPNSSKEFDPQYDLKDYYLTKNYTRSLLLTPARPHAEAIFAFDDADLQNYTDRFVKILRKVEEKYNVKIFNGTDAELNDQTFSMLDTLRTTAINSFTDQINELKNSAVSIKTAFPEFDFGINLYFNRDIIPKDRNQPTVFSTNMSVKGLVVPALGLDERNIDTFKMITNPLGIIEPDKTNFSRRYTVRKDDETQETIQVPALEVYISGNLADRLRINNNQVLRVAASSFAFDNNVTPNIYIHVSGIVREASFLSEVYFNKTDMFSYLKLQLEETYNESELANRADYAFYSESLNEVKNNPNGQDLFNNSIFSLQNLPYGISNFTLNGKLANAYSLLAYTALPPFEYASSNYPTDLGGGVYVFNIITGRILRTLAPIINSLNRFIILLLLITLAVALILITLILLENKNVILLFKSLGYKQGEVNVYITLGYIIATIFALILGAAISFFGIRIASRVLVSELKISLFFVWSPPFIIFGLAMALIFIAMTLISVAIYASRQKPRNAFSDL